MGSGSALDVDATTSAASASSTDATTSSPGAPCHAPHPRPCLPPPPAGIAFARQRNRSPTPSLLCRETRPGTNRPAPPATGLDPSAPRAPGWTRPQPSPALPGSATPAGVIRPAHSAGRGAVRAGRRTHRCARSQLWTWTHGWPFSTKGPAAGRPCLRLTKGHAHKNVNGSPSGTDPRQAKPPSPATTDLVPI